MMFSKTNATPEEGTYSIPQSVAARLREAATRRRNVLECMVEYRVISAEERRMEERVQLLRDDMR